MRYFSTFSGIGGFELGIQYAYERLLDNRPETKVDGQGEILQGDSPLPELDDAQGHVPRCVGYSEIDKYAESIYKRHFPNHTNYGDITKIDARSIPDFDLFVGGFPCQAFSIAGKRRGFDDTRGTLFYDICRIAKAKQPMFMLLENVKGLVSHDKGKTLEVILENLQELGYYVNYEIRNSKDYGVPQNRERILFTCKHIKLLSDVGVSQKMTTSSQIIQEWLFQLLLNNLAEVKKLQGHASKDSILGYLVLKEIREGLQSQDTKESTLDGTSPTDANSFPWRDGEAWQSIGSWLSDISEEDSSDRRLSTISTAISRTIESRIYTYSTMLESIALATALLRGSQQNLWNEILSSLILIQEGTKYARINNENEEAVITESGTAHIKSELQAFGEYFSCGHLRGTPRPEVFPFGEAGEPAARPVVQIGTRLDSNSGTQPFQQDRVYDTEGISPALQKDLPGGGHKIVGQGEISIRRLTPTECERLQGFPDGWTSGVSDTQRYKCLGNAVTVNVIADVMERIISTGRLVETGAVGLQDN